MCCRWSRRSSARSIRRRSQKLADKVIKGKRFDLNDMRDQLEQMINMGGMASMMDKLPGMGGMSEQVKSKVNDKQVHRHDRDHQFDDQEGTPPSGSAQRFARARVARGSGTQPADVNRLLKQYQQMEKMMSKLGSGGIKGMMRQMKGAMRGMGPERAGLIRRSALIRLESDGQVDESADSELYFCPQIQLECRLTWPDPAFPARSSPEYPSYFRELRW